jgi:hypothetical protein
VRFTPWADIVRVNVCDQYFFYYGATIFQSVGIEDSFVTQIILGAINVSCPGLAA